MRATNGNTEANCKLYNLHKLLEINCKSNVTLKQNKKKKGKFSQKFNQDRNKYGISEKGEAN